MQGVFVTLHVRPEIANAISLSNAGVCFRKHLRPLFSPDSRIILTVEQFAGCTDPVWIDVSVSWLRSIHGALEEAVRQAWNEIVESIPAHNDRWPGLSADVPLRFWDHTPF